MWTESLADQTSRVTLAGGYQTGTLSMGGTVASGSFAAMSMGHVEVSNINTNRLIELNVRMAVQEGAKTVDEVVADFVAAGYTNSVVEAEGDYNVKLVIPAEDVADQSEAPVSYFAWDFTQTLSITNVESVVTNATVTAVKLEYTKLPTQGTMILVL
jgi:tRNA threonylcarbamoyladenosine modification (KEOPS) complex  Pcc1 subunit